MLWILAKVVARYRYGYLVVLLGMRHLEVVEDFQCSLHKSGASTAVMSAIRKVSQG